MSWSTGPALACGSWIGITALLLSFTLSGCKEGYHLIATPNGDAQSGLSPFDELPESLRTPIRPLERRSAIMWRINPLYPHLSPATSNR